MNSMSYQAIAPLIVDLNVQGRSVNVVFQCPLSGERHQQDSMSQQRTMGSHHQSVQYLPFKMLYHK